MNHPEARALVLNEVQRRMTLRFAELRPLVEKEIPIFTDLSAAPGAAGNEQDHVTIELVVRSPI